MSSVGLNENRLYSLLMSSEPRTLGGQLGRRPDRLSNGAGGVLGIDLGGTYLRAAAAGDSGDIIAETTEDAVGLTPVRLLERVRNLIGELCSAPPPALAIGLPAPVDGRGNVGHMVNLPALSGVPLREHLERELGVPAIVENDVNLAAVGEQRLGRARGAQDMVFIAVGTGVGMGVVAGGRVLRGFRGGAGELGLLPLATDRVGRGREELGPLEEVAGGAGLARRWAQLTSRDASGRDVFLAAGNGDAVAVRLLDEQAQALAMGIRAVDALLDPELIVFGGGIGSRPDVLARVRDVLESQQIGAPIIEPSTLGERAALLGALAAARDVAAERLAAELGTGAQGPTS